MKALKSCFLVLLLVVLLSVLAVRWWIRPPTSKPASVPTAASPAPAAASSRQLVVVRNTGPQPAAAPRPDDIAAARQYLDGGGELYSCGPYSLLTDSTDERLIAACGSLANDLDLSYQQRFGVRPIDQPEETILLFRQLADFRAFNTSGAAGSAGGGYAGHAIASRGLVVLHAETGSRQATLRTLVHELAHLINRRAVGIELPRWLAEGLADGLGDSATEVGLLPLVGVRGAEGEACRLQLGYRSGQAQPVSRLLDLAAGKFDRGTVSYDYEQSAFLVRFLLAEPDLAPRFQALLRGLASGSTYDGGEAHTLLGISSVDLDHRFEAWLLDQQMSC